MKSLKIILGLVFVSTIGMAQQAPSAKVIFVRNPKGFGWPVGYNLFEGKDDSKLTRITPRTTVAMDLPAQPTQVWAKTEVKSSLDLNLQANNIYIVECSVDFGFLMWRPRLKPMSLAKFEDLYARRKYIRKQLAEQGYTSLEELKKGYQVQMALN